MSTNTDVVEAPAATLDLLAARLAERRIQVEREVLKYGEAPAGIKEVFELCRGFERAYVSFVNESPVASRIKEAFMGDKGLSGTVRKLPLEDVYKLASVKSTCRQADGYQPHLVSPENGMRQLGSDALDQVSTPVAQCVQQVYSLLINAAREAAEKAGQFTEAALMGAMPMYVPDFKTVVMPAVVAAMDEWKADAEKMAMMLLDMERSYMTAGFFRHTMHHRANKIKQQLAMMKAAETQQTKGGFLMGGGGGGGVKSFFPAFGASSQQPAGAPNSGAAAVGIPPASGVTPNKPAAQPAAAGGQQGANINDAASDGGSGDDGPGTSPAKEAAASAPAQSSAFNAGDMTDPNTYLAGNFEKYSGGSDAPPTSGLSVPGLKQWQKRFFIFSDTQRMLYYFKSADDVTKGGTARGMVNVGECVVEDLDDKGNVRTPATPIPANPQDKSHLMIRIRHKDPKISAVKDHNSLIIRAETMEQKMQWLSRMRKAAEGPRRPPPAPGTLKPEGVEPGSKPFSSFGGSLINMMEDLSWAKDAEPILDTHLGEGSAAFRADAFRDPDGKLLPAPTTVLNPIRLNEKARKGGPADARYDALMEQFGSDMSIYTRMVCDTVCTTVPKAIVHCMIRKSEKNLLERLFTVIHHLTPTQMEQLLREEEEIVAKRKEARAALEDCKTAVFVVQQLMERRNMMAPADRGDRVQLPANCFAYAGMHEMLTKEQKAYYDSLFASEHAPDALKNWTVPPPVRALPATPPKMAVNGTAPPQRTGAPPGPAAAGAAVPGRPPPQGVPAGAPGVPLRGPPGPPGALNRPSTTPGVGVPAAGLQQAPMGPPMARRPAPAPPPGR